MSQTVKSRSGMSVGESLAWWLGIFCTCGLLYPVYRMRKHQANRTTVTQVS